MTKEEQKEFSELVMRNDELKDEIARLNRWRRSIRRKIKKLGKDIDALEEKYNVHRM